MTVDILDQSPLLGCGRHFCAIESPPSGKLINIARWLGGSRQPLATSLVTSKWARLGSQSGPGTTLRPENMGPERWFGIASRESWQQKGSAGALARV